MASDKRSSKRVVTTGSNIRFEQPSSNRGRNTRVIIVPEVHPVSGFVDFLREHTVVSLAVGFAIATQAQTVIKQLIASFIDPLYGLLFSQRLSDKVVTLHFHGRAQAFAWGAFVYTFIDFLFVLAAIYIIVKSLNLDKLDKPAKPEKESKAETKKDGEEEFARRRLEEEAHI